MKSVVLIRHGKSSWNFNLKDFDRPLEKKGITNSIKMALHTKDLISSDFAVYISNANRAKSTAEIFLKNWNIDFPVIKYDNHLYVFSCLELENYIKTISNDINNVIIFGHNNAITDFVNKFGNIFIENISTSGFVYITFEDNQWETITKGITKHVILPKEL
jgi:phosphohistidine phosphatase